MRSIFLLLLLANLIVFAGQFEVVRRALLDDRSPLPASQLNAERLRIIREPAGRPPVTPATGSTSSSTL